ncbi:energy transducer TonB [Sulfurovum sp. TSL1]|uniref:energy transducer TonB n=1 Tax=Sulfurovum sp. TSL1 TaxID=2826994 RepID=UPI001CC50077|nr:energy transducer TonB [Sulfurovum sp. TSL1]
MATKKIEEKTTQLCLCSFQPEVVSSVEQAEQEEIEEVQEVEKPVVEEEPVVEEDPVVEPEISKEPTPEQEPKVKEELIPEPVVQKVIPKPIVKEVKKKPKPKAKKKTSKKSAKKKQKRQKASSRSANISPAQKNQFLASIRDKINKHKSYPRIAQRRGMQGTVKVAFTILKNGNVGNISVSGPTVFHKSARQAVQSAFPIDIRNAPISLPKSIKITLRYQIR